MSGDIFRVVFGPRTQGEYRPELEEIARRHGLKEKQNMEMSKRI